MKRGKKSFTISNRVLYSLITLGILSILAVGVYAYGSGSPTTFGHSGDEINVDNTFCSRITGHNCGYDVDTVGVSSCSVSLVSCHETGLSSTMTCPSGEVMTGLKDWGAYQGADYYHYTAGLYCCSLSITCS
jgi:hypothetical protein